MGFRIHALADQLFEEVGLGLLVFGVCPKVLVLIGVIAEVVQFAQGKSLGEDQFVGGRDESDLIEMFSVRATFDKNGVLNLTGCPV
ncbi:hypothetical protein J3R74_001874 [Puniceicoccus vermicola]